MSLVSTDTDEWLYRAEGGKNLIIANVKKGNILRIMKEARSSPPSVTGVGNRKLRDEYEALIGYQKNVMSVICGGYMGGMQLIDVDDEFLTKISERLEPFRDPKRCSKRISLSNVVIVMPDYALIPRTVYPHGSRSNLSLPTYCFGLKIKHLQNLSQVDDLRPCRQYPQCATCVDRYLERIEIPGNEPISQFCPCELVSGDPEVAMSAIRRLIMDFNSFKNRLDFFKNGVQKRLNLYDDVCDLLSEIEEYRSRIKGGEGPECLTDLTEILYLAFYHSAELPVTSGSFPVSSQCISVYHPKVSQQPLPSGCVLNVFVNAQTLAANFEVVERAYVQLTEAIEKRPEIADKLYLYGPYDNEFWCLTKQPSSPKGISHSVMAAFITVRNYLIYRTISDCSILISLQYIPKSCDSALLDTTSLTFMIDRETTDILCNVALIDFDPKPFIKMKAYMAKSQQVLNAAKRLSVKELDCVG